MECIELLDIRENRVGEDELFTKGEVFHVHDARECESDLHLFIKEVLSLMKIEQEVV